MNITKQIFLLIIFLTSLLECDVNNRFVIVIPSYKNAEFYKQNLDSVLTQNYLNYRIIYIDDCSPDGTANLVEGYIKENKIEHKITLIKNSKRQLALANIYKAVISCEDDEIIVLLDGDDWFENHNVLSKLNEEYKNSNIWITHGNFKFLGANLSGSHYYDPNFPQHVVNDNLFREYQHGPIHLRTFYTWLFKQIKLEDLFHEGNFYKMTYDVALLLPMFEMAAERHKFIRDILYIYNDKNPINDHNVSVKLQHGLNNIIRQKKKYQRLESSKTNFLQNFDNAKADIIYFADQNNEKNKKIIEQVKQKIINFNKLFFIYNADDEKDIKFYESLNLEFKDLVLINIVT